MVKPLRLRADQEDARARPGRLLLDLHTGFHDPGPLDELFAEPWKAIGRALAAFVHFAFAFAFEGRAPSETGALLSVEPKASLDVRLVGL